MFLPVLLFASTYTGEHEACTGKKHVFSLEGTFWVGEYRQCNVEPVSMEL